MSEDPTWIAALKDGRLDDFLREVAVEGQLVNLTRTGRWDAYLVRKGEMVVTAREPWQAVVVLAAEYAQDPPAQLLAAASILLAHGSAEIIRTTGNPYVDQAAVFTAAARSIQSPKVRTALLSIEATSGEDDSIVEVLSPHGGHR